ncbi:MAG: haloacid dehalogenase type II [Thermoleophilia bacterium]
MTPRRPEPVLVVFDVNETLSDMAPIAERFADLGIGGGLADTWFAALLRDGFALTAAGASQPFAALAEELLRVMLARTIPPGGLEAAVAHVVEGLATLDVHPDVPEGVEALGAAGHRMVTLSNGSADVAERLLATCGVRRHFEACLSVEDAGAWKPARDAYLYAAAVCGVEPRRMLMVAVHPWDIDGARRAGLRTAWIDRGGRPYPGYFVAPDVTVNGLMELPGYLEGSPGAARG